MRCPTCKREFEARAGQRFCSKACIQWSSINRRKGRTRTCPTCASEFYTPQSRMQTWCSPACVPDAVRQPKRPARHNCAVCGEAFYAPPSGGRKYCSRVCFAAAPVTAATRDKRRQANRNRSGEANPNYKSGRAVGKQIRGFTLALKGEDVCRNCGTAGPLHLHHAIPRSMSREARDNLLNGIPLCASCHMRWHRRTLVIYRDVFTAREWAYLSSVRLTGQRIEAWLDDRYPAKEAA